MESKPTHRVIWGFCIFFKTKMSKMSTSHCLRKKGLLSNLEATFPSIQFSQFYLYSKNSPLIEKMTTKLQSEHWTQITGIENATCFGGCGPSDGAWNFMKDNPYLLVCKGNTQYVIIIRVCIYMSCMEHIAPKWVISGFIPVAIWGYFHLRLQTIFINPYESQSFPIPNLYKHPSLQTAIFTNPLITLDPIFTNPHLHKPPSLQTAIFTNPLITLQTQSLQTPSLQTPFFTNSNLYKPLDHFTDPIFTNPHLYKPPSLQTAIFTNPLITLQTQSLQTPFFTNRNLYKPLDHFTDPIFTNPLLYKPQSLQTPWSLYRPNLYKPPSLQTAIFTNPLITLQTQSLQTPFFTNPNLYKPLDHFTDPIFTIPHLYKPQCLPRYKPC